MNTDTIIIGGGLSGLALANRLHLSGANFVLLEARDRFGGRILSREIEGAFFDLGPAWYWPIQPRMTALIDDLQLDVFEQFSTGATVFEDTTGAVHRIEDAGFASMAGSYRIEGGLARLTDRLTDQLPGASIHLNAKATLVARDGDTVVVGVEGHNQFTSVRGNRVVLAIPPRIAEANVSFSPELQNNVRVALASIPTWMAGQAKILAVYDRPYWREAGLSGDATSRVGPMVEIHDASPARGGPFGLFGFVGIPPHVRKRYRNDLERAAKDQLGRLFDNEMPEPKRILVHDWSDDILTATPADCVPIEKHPAFSSQSDLLGLWDDRLLFAGTETARDFGGYLEGALEAAENIAAQLAQLSTVTRKHC